MANIKKILFILFLTSIVHGQGRDVVIYGKVTSIYSDVKIADGDISLEYSTPNNNYLTYEEVENDGSYSRKLENVITVIIETDYRDYYAEKIIVQVGIQDSLRIDLALIPKPYIYTGERAFTDICNGKVQLVTFDTLEYNWTRKINLAKDFGFKYILLPEPEDTDFKDKIKDYNVIVESYLRLKNHHWMERMAIMRDSIINLSADQYRKKINIEKLVFPQKDKLPKGMQKRLNTFQEQYISWYQEELKDYTKNYILQVITTNKDYDSFLPLSIWISANYQQILPELIKLLTNNDEIGMEGYTGIMWCRGLAPSGPLSPGIGIPYSDDDLFTVAGRANHILKLLTYEDFGNVLPNPDEAWLRKLQNRWAFWLWQLQKN